MTPREKIDMTTSSETALRLQGVKSMNPQQQPVFHHGELPCDAHVVVVGGGISALVCAYELRKKGVFVTLLEASSQLGGNLQTHQYGEFLCEAGANSFPSSSRELMLLLDEIKLRPLAASPAAKNRYITMGSTLVTVPMDPLSFVLSPLLSLHAKCRLLQEPWIPKKQDDQEESVEAFITRRMGSQVHSRLVQPFLTGIYAGDSSKLSAQSVFPSLVNWEREYGSIIKGAFQTALKKMTEKKATPRSKTKAAMQKNKHALLNFPEGMAQLIKVLSHHVGHEAIRLNSAVEQLNYNPDAIHGKPWRIQLTHGEKIEADAVVLATPAYHASDLLWHIAPEPARLLRQIEYAPIQLVYQAFAMKDVQKKRRGFGTLRCWERPNPYSDAWLASLWTSSLFPERCAKNHVLLSHFFGGALHPKVKLWDEARCIHEARQQSQWLLNLRPKAESVLNVVYPYMKAIPQYHLGHQDRMEAVESGLEQAFEGKLQLTGNYVKGISLNACVVTAQRVAHQILEVL
jgi:oxygen-dependent protoporphyrinogen oxidase